MPYDYRYIFAALNGFLMTQKHLPTRIRIYNARNRMTLIFSVRI